MTPTAPKSPRLSLPAGTVIHDQYRIERVLGAPGSFGIVYLVVDELLGSSFALKEFLPRDFARRSEDGAVVESHSTKMQESFEHGLQRFIDEARVLARIRHANVIGVRTCFEENGTAYLLMDYHPGLTLAEHLNAAGGRMDHSVAVEVMLRVLDGLEAAHAQGILHRDVKPDNIYITAEGQPLLLDFGAARQAVGEYTRKLTAILTPGYAPVEQYGWQMGKQGPWTDVYSSAAVLYKCITGKVPQDALGRVAGEELPFPAQLVPGVPQILSAMIMKGLAVKRQDRFQTAREFADRLADLASSSSDAPSSLGSSSAGAGKTEKQDSGGLFSFLKRKR